MGGDGPGTDPAKDASRNEEVTRAQPVPFRAHAEGAELVLGGFTRRRGGAENCNKPVILNSAKDLFPRRVTSPGE